MTIKDIIAQIRAKVSSEELEKVNSLLSDAVRVESELLADRSAANEESKARKEKIRELEETIGKTNADLETERKKTADFDKEKTELGKFKTMWETQQTEMETANKAEWDRLKTKFDIKETDKGFEGISKIKKYYTFADNLTPEQITKNIEQAKQHEELGLFAVSADPPKETPKGTDVKTSSVFKTVDQYSTLPQS